MKHSAFSIALLLTTFTVCGQSEFKVHPNGLMYSDSTMGQLSHIVDSLNLKYRICDRNRSYMSRCQAMAHYVTVENSKAAAAFRDMQTNLSYEEFVKKYPKAKIDKGLVVIKSKYKNYNDVDIVKYFTMSFGRNYGHEIYIEGKPEQYEKEVNQAWVCDFYESSDHSEQSASGFFFTSPFVSMTLPADYAALVQYADCMVDTSVQIFREDAKGGDFGRSGDLPPRAEAFLKYVHKETGKPKENYGDTTYWNRYKAWDSSRISIIDQNLAHLDKFQVMLKEAVEQGLEKGGTNNEFEEYVARYNSADEALEMKRRRIVVGQCSMDHSPRVHAMNIAVLSAETVNWETFLRSHLDIMNDRFDRMSDGSYAWEGRKTYIRELEELDINVTDLLLGISLRIENPGRNHYFSDIGRIGRAFSETRNPDEVEKRMLTMIRDSALDDYNRILIYYLFMHYNHNLDDEARKKANLVLVADAVKQMPDYLSSRIVIEK